MPTATITSMNNLNRYSIESSTSSSSTSSSNTSSTSNNNHNRITTFLPVRKTVLSSTSNVHHYPISKSATFDMFNVKEKHRIIASSSVAVNNKRKDDYQSTQSLYPPPSTTRVMFRINPSPSVARVPPVSRLNHSSVKPSMIMNLSTETMKQQQKEECWLSCEELETIEKRFTDLLETNNKLMTSNRAKSCGRLLSTDDDDDDERCSTNNSSMKNTIEYHPANVLYDNNTKTSQHHYSKQLIGLTKLENNNLVITDQDVYTVESSYKSIGSKVFVCKCIVDLFVTTAERLSKLEDWIFFQRGLPVWLLNTGINPKRIECLSLVLAEKGLMTFI
ncbi:unnamed protein product [Didymodactylos carnosus]|uniref:Uncharacterized protein n=1 Tax=Didymodactylos carnosus TaxID=1234261 RepID=A0A813V1J4_9BILA|nr:unnamed protein product [Didymodactylos carnosus]CAF3623084.1 unnamed protein product [Didymodactylos carnosus]